MIRLHMTKSNVSRVVHQHTIEEMWRTMRHLQSTTLSSADLQTAFETMNIPFKGNKQLSSNYFIECLVHPGVRSSIDAMFDKGILQDLDNPHFFRTLGNHRDQAWVGNPTRHVSIQIVPLTPHSFFLQVWGAVLQQLIVQCRPKKPKTFKQFTTLEHLSYATGSASEVATAAVESEYDIVKNRPRDYHSALEDPTSEDNTPFIFNKTVTILSLSQLQLLTFNVWFLGSCCCQHLSYTPGG